MIEIITWISAIILGPGALAVFIWFLVELRTIVAAPVSDGMESRQSEVT